MEGLKYQQAGKSGTGKQQTLVTSIGNRRNQRATSRPADHEYQHLKKTLWQQSVDSSQLVAASHFPGRAETIAGS